MPNYTECENLIINGVVGKGDPDISGPGVVTAFIVSAYVTMLAILGAYVGGLVDGGLLRPIDKLTLRVPSRARRHPQLHVALRKLVISLSDQQIITGIAVLGAGFQGLRTGTISTYHFQIVVYLGWSSSSVHLSALTLMRPFLWRHRGMLVWRLIGMSVLMVMLLIALVPTVSNDWAVVDLSGNPDFDSPQNGFGVPAVCFWGQLYGDSVNVDAILSYAILIISYVWKMGGLFMPVRHGWQKYFRNPIDMLLERPLVFLARHHKNKQGFITNWVFRLYFALWLQAFTVLEILGSFSAALWLSVLGTIYGTLQILIPREIVQTFDPSIADQESEFGFGQLIALVLLVQPIGAVTEHIWLSGQDDEQVYETDADVTRCPSISDTRSLPEIAATLPTRDWLADSAERIQLKNRIYGSRLFAGIVWWTQLGVLVVAIMVFWADAVSIGWDTTANWYVIGWAVAAYVGMTGLILLISAPFSSLTRPRRNISEVLRTESMPVSDRSLEMKSVENLSYSESSMAHRTAPA